MKIHLARPSCAWCLDPIETHGPNCTRCRDCQRYVKPGFGSLLLAELQLAEHTAVQWAWRIIRRAANFLVDVWALIRSTIERGTR